jgi:hypothetical protein
MEIVMKAFCLMVAALIGTALAQPAAAQTVSYGVATGAWASSGYETWTTWETTVYETDVQTYQPQATWYEPVVVVEPVGVQNWTADALCFDENGQISVASVDWSTVTYGGSEWAVEAAELSIIDGQMLCLTSVTGSEQVMMQTYYVY